MASPAVRQFIIQQTAKLVPRMTPRQISVLHHYIDTLQLTNDTDANVEIIAYLIRETAKIFTKQNAEPAQPTFTDYATTVLYNQDKQSMRPALAIHNLLGYNTPAALQLAFNPQSCYSTHYIALDSRYKNRATSSAKELSWLYSREIQQPPAGMVMSNMPIRNIMAMRLYMVIFPTNFIGIDRAEQTRAVSCIVKELCTQITAFSGQLKYHFLGQFYPIEFQNSARVETDDPQGMTFYFRQPIRYLDSITLSFGNPDQRIEFYPEQHDDVIVTYAPGFIYFNFPTGHNLLATGAANRTDMCVAGFTTNDPEAGENPTLIARINALPGIPIDIVDQQQVRFETNIDPVDPIIGLVVSVQLVSLQCITFMEFLCNDHTEDLDD